MGRTVIRKAGPPCFTDNWKEAGGGSLSAAPQKFRAFGLPVGRPLHTSHKVSPASTITKGYGRVADHSDTKPAWAQLNRIGLAPTLFHSPLDRPTSYRVTGTGFVGPRSGRSWWRYRSPEERDAGRVVQLGAGGGPAVAAKAWRSGAGERIDDDRGGVGNRTDAVIAIVRDVGDSR